MADTDIRREHRRFVRENGDDDVLAFLDANALKFNRLTVLGGVRQPKDYLGFLHLSDEMKQRLGLAGDEMLLAVLHQVPQQSWFLKEIRDSLRQYDRLSKTAVLVISRDPLIERMCASAYAEPSTGYKTAHVAIDSRKLASLDQASRVEAFSDAFSRHAFTVDHFDTRIPVPEDMWGRGPAVASIEADLRAAQEGVAILGVRRVGKTSVLRKVLSQLESDPDHPRLVAYYDAQTHSVDANCERACVSLVASIRKSLNDVESREIETVLAGLRDPVERLSAVVDELSWTSSSGSAGWFSLWTRSSGSFQPLALRTRAQTICASLAFFVL